MKAMALQCNPKDNVAVLFDENAFAGMEIEVRDKAGASTEMTINQPVPFGHKLALRPIAKGEDIIKYGESIGMATEDIQPGEHVHVHNMDSKRGRGDWKEE